MIEDAELYASTFPVVCELKKIRYLQPNYESKRIVLLYCVDGELKVSAGNYRGTLHKDELLMINRGEVFSACADKDNEILMMYVDIQTDTYLYRKESPAYTDADIEELKTLLFVFMYIACMDRIIEDELYMHICNIIVSMVMKVYSLDIKGKSDYIIRDILSVFERNYTLQMSNEWIADTYGKSTKYITEKFKETGAGSLYSYLTYVRCRAADKLLLETSYSLDMIAELCGFTSAKMLIRHYGRYSGQSPHQRRIEYKAI